MSSPAVDGALAGQGGRSPPVWFLGFDCATKTFAFSLSRIDKAAIAASSGLLVKRARASLVAAKRAAALLEEGRAAEAASLSEALGPAVAALDAETAGLIRIVDGATVDLAPGRADKAVTAVERVRAVVAYVSSRVRPALALWVPPESGEEYRVIIEFQMGPNAPARVVATALMTLFASEDVCLVGPSLKNQVAIGPEGHYSRFAEKYAAAYGANKAHAIWNFGVIEAAFGSGIPATHPASLRGHIADSFMQVLGHLARDDARHEYVPGRVFAGPPGEPKKAGVPKKASAPKKPGVAGKARR